MNAIMEKKEYIKPEVEVIELEPTSMIAASAEDIPIGGDGPGGGDALSNGRRPGRRGAWGDLWADDKE